VGGTGLRLILDILVALSEFGNRGGQGALRDKE